MTEFYPPSLQQINELVFQPRGWMIHHFSLKRESSDYHACSFSVNNKNIVFRQGKHTPVKLGQFVTLWKRSREGVTIPFDQADIDGVLIAVVKEGESGFFLFPAAVLADKKIISIQGLNGKRGFRVYPPWEKVISRLAKQTQAWQQEYFISVPAPGKIEPDRLNQLVECI